MTTEIKKNVAMYFAGAMGWHALTHAVLAAIKSDEPHKRLGIPMTPARNAVAAVLWAGVSIALAQYALSSQPALPAVDDQV